MNIYEVECQLSLHYNPSETYKNNIKYNIETYTINDTSYQCKIEITPEYVVHISNLKCVDRNEALLFSKNILEELCKSLSLLILTYNCNVRDYQPHIMFLNSDIRIISEKPYEIKNDDVDIKLDSKGSMVVNDQITLRDGIASISSSIDLPIKEIEKFYNISNKGDEIKFIVDALYRAVTDSTIESKYFTLFTVIERIESKNTTLFENLFTDKQRQDFKDNIDLFLKEKIGLQEENVTKIKDRLLNIVSSATEKNRTEKLCYILDKVYNITKFQKGYTEIDMEYFKGCKNKENKKPELCKAEKFIQVRNSLFHGKHMEKEKYDEIVQLTNELLFLCEEILSKSLEKEIT